MKRKTRERRKRILRGSGAVLAFFIGSGFASGQEVLQFFGAYGTEKGTCGMCLSLFFLVFCVRRVLIDGGRLGYKDASQIFSYYCGPFLGRFFEWLTPVFLFLSYSVMLSGSGALLREQFGCAAFVGRMVMLALSLGTVLLGLRHLTEVIGFLGPVIVLFVFCLGGVCTAEKPLEIYRTAQEVRLAGIGGTADSWWLSALLYAGFSVLTALPFLSSLGQSLEEDRERSSSAALSCLAFFAGALLLCLGMLANLEEIAGKRVPTVLLANRLLPGMGVIFGAVMFAGIYTTAVPMLWSVCNKLAPDEQSLRFRFAAFAIALGAFFWGGADFSFLVGTVYPYIGYFGIGIMFFLFKKQLYSKFPRLLLVYRRLEKGQ